MNIGDPIGKEEKEDNVSDPIYKLKPVLINFNSISHRISFYETQRVLFQKAHFDIEFNEDYINTLDVNKRRLGVLDDGGCLVKVQLSSSSITSAIEKDLNSAMNHNVQRKGVVTKITNGVRLSIDLPRYVISPYITTATSSSCTYIGDFGTVKLLIPEPTRFDSSVVTISARFEYTEMTTVRAGSASKPSVCITNVSQTSTINNYKILNQLQFETTDQIALHKFTIESAKNLMSEIQDVISVPIPIKNYTLSNHPEYPISYAKIRRDSSIGSSSRPKEKCLSRVDPIPKIDQTQSKGRSLKQLGIVGKILSIIKRRKREIK